MILHHHGGFQNATTDRAEIRRVFSHGGAALIGVPTGPHSGFDVLDIDYRHGGRDWEIANAHRLPPTRVHQMWSGGRYYLFRHTHGVVNVAPGGACQRRGRLRDRTAVARLHRHQRG